MSDFPSVATLIAGALNTFDHIGGALSPGLTGAPAQQQAWPVANKALFLPVLVDAPIVINRLGWGLGSASGNVDCGIYTAAGAKLISTGSTAAAVAGNGLQSVAVAATLLNPGLYYLALACDNTTVTVNSRATAGTSAGYLGAFGFAEMAAAFPLPATATFASLATNFYPLIIASSVGAI